MENKKNELQSRREFFKQAAKGALPILGAIVLSNVNLISQAAEGEPMGCGGSCKSYCSGQCRTTCNIYCNSGCKGGCGASCTSKSK